MFKVVEMSEERKGCLENSKNVVSFLDYWIDDFGLRNFGIFFLMILFDLMGGDKVFFC